MGSVFVLSYLATHCLIASLRAYIFSKGREIPITFSDGFSDCHLCCGDGESPFQRRHDLNAFLVLSGYEPSSEVGDSSYVRLNPVMLPVRLQALV